MALRIGVPSVSWAAKVALGACVALSTLAGSSSFSEAQARGYYSQTVYQHYQQNRHTHVAFHARRHARRAYAVKSAAADPGYALVVVDERNGHTLTAQHENELRHPASITKVMTLYLLFEQLERGALTLQSRIAITDHAAAQEPSKLGLQPGESISVEDCIKAIVTRSANDVAVAVAEAIGREEGTFAELMTRKAQALGMSRTTYRNASGLPNDEQVTTAHDLALLGRAIQQRFPKYFRYFSTHEFEYAGEIIGNHNHLLGRVEGVDGIKTGYTRASGFNLLTSVHRDGRSLVAVVLGGKTAGARDRMMEQLIEGNIQVASVSDHSSAMVAEAGPVAIPVVRPAPLQVALALPPSRSAVRAYVARADAAAEEDEAPKVVPAVVVQAVRPAPIPPAARPAPAMQTASAPLILASAMRTETNLRATPESLGWIKGPDPLPTSSITRIPRAEPVAEHGKDARAEAHVVHSEQAQAAHSGWMIQIGATEDADKAHDLLIKARAQDRALAQAQPFTEKVQTGSGVLYRARFAGLDPDTAEVACKTLKKSGFACFASHN